MTGLERFAVDAKQSKAKGVYRGALDLTWVGSLLAFDQTLGSCAFVRIECPAPKAVVLTHSGMFKSDIATKGNLGNLEKGDYVFDCVLRLMELLDVDAVVHEAPPPGGGRMSRPESSLLAANCVRNAASVHDLRVLPHVDPRTAKKRFTGNANADKREVHAVLPQLVPGMAAMKPNNEHVRDALAVAIVAAEREINHGSTT